MMPDEIIVGVPPCRCGYRHVKQIMKNPATFIDWCEETARKAGYTGSRAYNNAEKFPCNEFCPRRITTAGMIS